MINNVKIGPLTFHIYGIIIAVAVYCGWLLAKYRSNRYKIPSNLISETNTVIVLFISLVFARLYHVLSSFSFYQKNPEQIIAVWNGGIGIIGGIAGLFLGVAIIAKFQRKLFLNLADLISPSLLLAQAIGRIGNYFNQEGFGPPTDLPWGVYIDPINRPAQYFIYSHFHPTFFYETAIDLVFLIAILILSRKCKNPGQTFGLYLILYSIGRFIAEFLRIDTWTIGAVKMAQIFTAILFIFGTYLLVKKAK